MLCSLVFALVRKKCVLDEKHGTSDVLRKTQNRGFRFLSPFPFSPPIMARLQLRTKEQPLLESEDQNAWMGARCFLFVCPIHCPRTTLALPPSSNSDRPGSHIGPSSPIPTTVVYEPSFLSRQECSIFFPRRPASN